MTAAVSSAQNRKVLGITLGVVALMIALTYAAVPLYSLFCRVTGYGGEIRRAESNPGRVIDRVVTVRFNADVHPGLGWSFGPEQGPVKVRVGEDALVSYYAENTSPQPITGTAVYNVTPEKAGKYFNKTQCFCFQEQTLKPGERVHMPVTFFVDPSIAEDKNLDDVSTITLSYTFFKTDTPELEKATETFYNSSTKTN